MVRWLPAVAIFLCILASGSAAQTCGETYEVRPGDSLSAIAARSYGNAFLWTEIYAANRQAIGEDPDRIFAGSLISLPCPDAQSASGETDPAADDAGAGEQDIVTVRPPEPLVVAQIAQIPPFTDQTLSRNGMLTEVVTASLELAAGDRELLTAITEFNQAAATADVLFPVIPPACAPDDTDTLCRDFIYSDPMFEMLMVLFMPAPEPVAVPPVAGGVLTLCRPADLAVHPARMWIQAGLAEITRAADPEACFALLRRGDVDAVMLNEFTGRAMLDAAGAGSDIISPDMSPVAIVTLNAAFPRSAPDAERMSVAFNAGLRELRRTGAFQRILDRHLRATGSGL